MRLSWDAMQGSTRATTESMDASTGLWRTSVEGPRARSKAASAAASASAAAPAEKTAARPKPKPAARGAAASASTAAAAAASTEDQEGLSVKKETKNRSAMSALVDTNPNL